MRRLPLGTSLALANAALVLVTVVALAGAGGLLVRRLLDEQARARVEGAAAIAAHEVTATAERLEVTGRLLADRPTLQRLLRLGQRFDIAAFLDRFRHTSQLSAVALLRAGRPLLVSGSLPALESLPALGKPPTLVRGDSSGEPLTLVCTVPASDVDPELAVVVAQRLDARFAHTLAAQVGASVRVHAGPPPLESRSPYRAWVPLAGVSGTPAHVEVNLAAAAVDDTLARLLAGYGLLAGLGVALALATGLAAGRRLGAPADRLGAAAVRIGKGDLHTPVPPVSGAEMGRLSATLEEMRSRLLGVTSELKRREAEASAVLSGIVEGVLAVDAERRVTYLNAQASTLLGVAPEEARGRFCGDVLRPESEDGVLPCQDRCPIIHARGRGTTQSVERLRPRGGVGRSVVVSCAPPASGAQVLVLRDETEQEAGRRVREAILANLSHELKTPLAAQLASVELLRDGLAGEIDTGEAAPLVAALERSTLRLMALVDNLLASSRLEAGEWGMRTEPVDLPEVVHEATALLAPLFAQRRQPLVRELSALPTIRGDRTQLLQVLLNLLGNANKFAPEGSTVTVGGADEPAGVAIWVEDEGPGLPPGNAETLFERFRRAPGAGPRGVGLGLWIARAIVERHGGTVVAERVRSGGARFTVRLPVVEEAIPA